MRFSLSLLAWPIFLLCAGLCAATSEESAWELRIDRFLAGEKGAYDEMVHCGEAAIPWVAAVLQDQQAGRNQFMAANVLGDIGSPAAVDALLAALDSRAFNVRRCAALALGRIGSVEAVPALERLRDADPYGYRESESGETRYLVREDAAKALTMIAEAKETWLNDASKLPPAVKVPGKRLSWPFPGGFAKQNLFNNYQQPTDRYVHAAMDLMQGAGTPVRAVEGGTVALIHTNYPDWTTHHYFIVEPEAGRGEGWCYTHVDPATYGFELGDRVRAGQKLGEVVGFSLGDRPGADHLHLNYVAFEAQPGGGYTLRPLYDPLQRFAWKDTSPPVVGPFWVQDARMAKPVRIADGPPPKSGKKQALDPIEVQGRVQLFAGVSDRPSEGVTVNWSAAAVTLEIEGQGAEPFRKLVLDHRGPIQNDRQVRPLFQPYAARKAWLEGLDRSPFTQILNVTRTDGDGQIEPTDARYAWDTAALQPDGASRFPNGTYTITVRAWDLAGNVGEARVEVQVLNSKPGMDR